MSPPQRSPPLHWPQLPPTPPIKQRGGTWSLPALALHGSVSCIKEVQEGFLEEKACSEHWWQGKAWRGRGKSIPGVGHSKGIGVAGGWRERGHVTLGGCSELTVD